MIYREMAGNIFIFESIHIIIKLREKGVIKCEIVHELLSHPSAHNVLEIWMPSQIFIILQSYCFRDFFIQRMCLHPEKSHTDKSLE